MNLKRPIFRNNQASSPSEAIFRGLFRQVRELLRREADPNETINNKTALMLCTFINDIFWAKSISFQLLEFGAKIDIKDEFGFNALHYSIIRNRKDLLEIFLGSFDFDINVKNRFGFTAIHYAVDSENKSEILQILIDELKRYKYSLDSLNKFNYSPLMESIRHLNFQAAEILISNGANTDFNYMGIGFLDYFHWLKNKFNETPHYMINKLKKTLIINQNEELQYHDSIVKTINHNFIMEAPEFDIRNNSKWVTERPKSCITLNTWYKSNDEESWKTIMPTVYSQLEDRFSDSYRKNFSIQKIILNLKQFNHDSSDGPGKNRNGSNKRSGKSKTMKKNNQEKLPKKFSNDITRNK